MSLKKSNNNSQILEYWGLL